MGEGERIELLKIKHEALEMKLKDEKRKLQPDPATLAGIKKRKLVVKDEMTRLAHAGAAAEIEKSPPGMFRGGLYEFLSSAKPAA